MNVIAQSQITEHTLVSSAKSCSVAILSNKSLNFENRECRIVAISNDKSNLLDIIRYYKDANFTSITLVIDSKNHPAQAIDFMMSNYCNARCNIYDCNSKTIYKLSDYSDSIQYLSLCYQLTNCNQQTSEIINWLTQKLVRTIPLICSDVQSCLRTYSYCLPKDESLSNRLLTSLKQQLNHYTSVVQCFMQVNVQTKTIHTSTLHSTEVQDAILNEPTLAIKSATGTGKTKHIFGPIVKQAEKTNKKVVYLSHLMALVEQYCVENNAVSYTTKNLDQLEQSKAMGLVINSAWKAHIQAFCRNSDILIIDEFEKVIASVACPEESLQMPKQRVFHCLSEIIQLIPQVVVGDADLSNISLSYLRSLRGDVTLILCDENPYQDIKAVIADKNQYLDKQDDLKSKLLKDRVFLFDSLTTLRSIVKQLGYEDKNGLDSEAVALDDGVLIIHGENKAMEAQLAFLANPNEEITKYRAIIASPCLGSGFSIIKDFTKRVIVFCDKTLHPFELVNFARRFRTAREIWFTIDAHQDFLSHPSKERAYIPEIHREPTDQLEIAFGNTKAKLTAPLGLNLWITLQELGFNVSSIPSSMYLQSIASKNNNKYLKAYRESLVNAIMQASELNQYDVKRLMAVDKRTANDNASISKYTIKEHYQLTEVTEKDIEFHFQFSKNIKLFDKLLSVPASHPKHRVSPKYKRAASLISTNLFKGHKFSSQTPSIALHREDVLNFMDLLLSNRELVNWALHKDTQLPSSLSTISTTNKKMLYFTLIIKSLGFEIGRFSGTTKKAKMSLTQRAFNYARLNSYSGD
jgi:hypothetical protein